jgi:hypothetical protein
MIATVTHVTNDDPGARWGATAIYPRGIKPKRLELYAIGYAGDGCEMTALQVIDEFGTMSGPIILVPDTEVGLAYDGALTLAFERDDGLAIGSGWPPVVVGFDAGPSPNRPKYAASDLVQLFREMPQTAAWNVRSGAGNGTRGLGYGTGPITEAFVLAIGADDDLDAQRIAVVITTLGLGPRDLRRVARSTLPALGGARCLSVVVSVGDPTVYNPQLDVRRALDGPSTKNVEAGATSAVAAALDSLRSEGVRP